MKWFVCGLMLLLAACSAVQTQPVLMDGLMRIAVARAFMEHPSWKEDAARISLGAITYLDGADSISLQALETYAVNEIKWDKLTPEEVEMMITLISIIRTGIEAQLQELGADKPELQLVFVRQVFQSIYDVAGRTQ